MKGRGHEASVGGPGENPSSAGRAAMSLQPWMHADDLAPGDVGSLRRDWAGIELHEIGEASGELFDTTFGALWSEFGSVGEMETADVLRQRMLWNPSRPIGGCAIRYRLLLVTDGEGFAAAEDHTAILPDSGPGVVVHQSHILVASRWRRTGLAGWLRALPLATARGVLFACGRAGDSPITLVAEMEHPDPAKPATLGRLAAYEKAGYKKIAPSRLEYFQPDFRAPCAIDTGGGPRPIPLALVIRRVGHENETFVSGREVRRVVSSLYKMYEASFRERDLAFVQKVLAGCPADDERIPLIPPTAQ